MKASDQFWKCGIFATWCNNDALDGTASFEYQEDENTIKKNRLIQTQPSNIQNVPSREFFMPLEESSPIADSSAVSTHGGDGSNGGGEVSTNDVDSPSSFPSLVQKRLGSSPGYDPRAIEDGSTPTVSHPPTRYPSSPLYYGHVTSSSQSFPSSPRSRSPFQEQEEEELSNMEPYLSSRRPEASPPKVEGSDEHDTSSVYCRPSMSINRSLTGLLESPPISIEGSEDNGPLLHELEDKTAGSCSIRIEETMTRVRSLLDSGHVMSTQTLLLELIQWASDMGATSLIREIENHDTYKYCIDALSRQKMLSDYCANPSSWTELKKGVNDRVRVFTRQEPSKLFSVRIVGVYDGSAVSLMNVMTEPNLMSEWFPYMSLSTKLHDITPFHGMGYFVQSFNIPFVAPREWYMEYLLATDPDFGATTVHIQSCNPHHPLIEGQAPPPNPKNVSGEMVMCGGFLEQIREDRCFFQVFFTADVKMALPGPILKYISMEVCVKAFSNARSIALNQSGPDSKFGQRIDEKWEDTLKPVQDVVDKHLPDVAHKYRAVELTASTALNWANQVGAQYKFPLLDN